MNKYCSNINIQIDQLKKHITSKINILEGDWISKNSGYEKEACRQLSFICETKRYWDCRFNEMFIEIKKGKSIWLDEIRYSEILLSVEMDNMDCQKDTITIFIIPTKDRKLIEKIYIIDTKKIISFLKLTPEWAKGLLFRKKQINRSLNCQQSMTVNDLKKIANYEILNL